MQESIVYVNGEFLPASQAKVSIFDRGFLMSDGIYEVSAVVNGQLIDNEGHLARLERSLKEIRLDFSMSREELIGLQEEIIKRNQMVNGGVYIQITRGVGKRDFVIAKDLTPTIIMFPQFHNALDFHDGKPLRVVTVEDIRWARRDIKTTQLLAQSLAKTAAIEAGFDDAWFVDAQGYITEGSSNNVYIVKNGVIYTRYADHSILGGITRKTLIEVMGALGIECLQEKFTPEDVKNADEAFMTSASMWVIPVVAIDGHIIGSGQMGAITQALQKGYQNKVL